jgi:hypothetical protein
MTFGPSGCGAKTVLELSYLVWGCVEGWVGGQVEHRCTPKPGSGGSGVGRTKTEEGRDRVRCPGDEVGNDGWESGEGEGVHDDFGLVPVKHEVSSGAHPIVFVHASTEVELDCPVDEGQDLAAESAVGSHLLGVK